MCTMKLHWLETEIAEIPHFHISKKSTSILEQNGEKKDQTKP